MILFVQIHILRGSSVHPGDWALCRSVHYPYPASLYLEFTDSIYFICRRPVRGGHPGGGLLRDGGVHAAGVRLQPRHGRGQQQEARLEGVGAGRPRLGPLRIRHLPQERLHGEARGVALHRHGGHRYYLLSSI